MNTGAMMISTTGFRKFPGRGDNDGPDRQNTVAPPLPVDRRLLHLGLGIRPPTLEPILVPYHQTNAIFIVVFDYQNFRLLDRITIVTRMRGS